MTLCARCDWPVGTDSEEIGGEIYCGSCAAVMKDADRDYQSVLDTYREKAGEK